MPTSEELDLVRNVSSKNSCLPKVHLRKGVGKCHEGQEGGERADEGFAHHLGLVNPQLNRPNILYPCCYDGGYVERMAGRWP